MIKHLKRLVFVTGMGLASPLWASHIILILVITEAQVRDPLTAPVVEVNMTAELEGVPPDPIQPITVSWQDKGGIDPEPFLELSIPGGCLESDFMAGCAEGRFVVDGASIPLTIRGFDARFFARDNRTMRFDVTASFLGGDLAHLMLSTLGGDAVELTIGAESATALTTGIEAVAGVDPEPFGPPPDDG